MPDMDPHCPQVYAVVANKLACMSKPLSRDWFTDHCFKNVYYQIPKGIAARRQNNTCVHMEVKNMMI